MWSILRIWVTLSLEGCQVHVSRLHLLEKSRWQGYLVGTGEQCLSNSYTYWAYDGWCGILSLPAGAVGLQSANTWTCVCILLVFNSHWLVCFIPFSPKRGTCKEEQFGFLLPVSIIAGCTVQAFHPPNPPFLHYVKSSLAWRNIHFSSKVRQFRQQL